MFPNLALMLPGGKHHPGNMGCTRGKLAQILSVLSFYYNDRCFVYWDGGFSEFYWAQSNGVLLYIIQYVAWCKHISYNCRIIRLHRLRTFYMLPRFLRNVNQKKKSSKIPEVLKIVQNVFSAPMRQLWNLSRLPTSILKTPLEVFSDYDNHCVWKWKGLITGKKCRG